MECAMENKNMLRKTPVPRAVDGIASTEVEIACSTCDGSKVVLVPDIHLPSLEQSALDDVRCQECEGLVV
jgi:hypothetical protein